MKLSLLDLLLTSVSLLLILAIVGLIIYWKIRKLPFTRERFAFFGISSLISVIFFIVPYLLGNNFLLESINQITTKLFGFSININKPDFSDKVLALLFVWLVGYFVLKIFNNWNGTKSLRQFELEKQKERTSIFKEFKAYFNEKEKLREFDPEIDELVKFIIKEPEIESIAWQDQVCDLLTLASNQYRINKTKDWYQKEQCFLASYGKENQPLAILCSIDFPKEKHIVDFLSFSLKQFPKGIDQIDIKYIVAVKNSSFLKEIKTIRGLEIEFTNENTLLDELIDFSNYFNFIQEQFEDREIIDGYSLTLNDVYTEPSCRVKERLSKKKLYSEISKIEEYIINWANDAKTRRHLSILAEYGQGKSVLSQRVAYLLTKDRTLSVRIPIIIELRGRYPKQYQNSLALLSDWCSNYSINPKALLKMHHAGKLLIIFEGFDEMELVGDYEIRIDHFRKLWEFSIPNSKIIITGRPNFFLNDNELQTLLRTNIEYSNLTYCEEIYIKRFTKDQIACALRNADKETKDDILAILGTQDSRNSFYDLMSRPSSLFLTSIVWKERNLSKFKNRINSALVIEEFLTHSYSRQESKGVKSPLSIYERAYFMQGIAIGMVQKNRYTNQITQNDLKEIILKLYNNFPEEITKKNIDGENYKNKLQKRFDKRYNEESVLIDVRSCGILVRDLSTFDSFKFSHKSFLELLVSNYIVLSILDLDGEENMFEKIIKNSISETLNVIPGQIRKSPDVLRFIAEQIARKIEIPDRLEKKERVRYIFQKVYPYKNIGMEKAFKLIPYLGMDIRSGILIMSNAFLMSIISSYGISKMIFKLLSSATVLPLFTYGILVFSILLFTSLMLLLFHRVFIKIGGPYRRVLDVILVGNVTISKENVEYMFFQDSNILSDKGNLLLFYLICKEVDLLDYLLSCVPKSILKYMESQENYFNRFKNELIISEEDFHKLQEKIDLVDNSNNSEKN